MFAQACRRSISVCHRRHSVVINSINLLCIRARIPLVMTGTVSPGVMRWLLCFIVIDTTIPPFHCNSCQVRHREQTHYGLDNTKGLIFLHELMDELKVGTETRSCTCFLSWPSLRPCDMHGNSNKNIRFCRLELFYKVHVSTGLRLLFYGFFFKCSHPGEETIIPCLNFVINFSL